MSRGEFFRDKSNLNLLKPADVRGGQIVTISEFFKDYSAQLGKLQACIRFTETGDKVLPLNETNYDFIASKFGDDEFEWAGNQLAIAIMQAPNPSNNKQLQPVIRFTHLPVKQKETETA